MDNGKVKVLYITGWGRSGSTILDNVLGQLEGFFSVGEISHIWDRNILEQRICGCGEHLSKCEVWGHALQRAYGGMESINAREMTQLRDSGARTRHVPLMLLPGGKRFLRSRLSKYLGNLGVLYKAIEQETNSRVIVDSSKTPSYGYLLRMVPGVELYVLHLVRDPRAVSFSWSRKKIQPDTGEPFRRHRAFESALIWDVWNLAAELLLKWPNNRYLRVRYEDFVNNPQKTLQRVLDILNESSPTDFLTGHTAMLGTNHTLSGNPTRFLTGEVSLVPDDEWETEMKNSDKAIVATLTKPLRLRYGRE